MERFNWLRRSVFAAGLSGCLLFTVSCNNGPVPGAISPIQPSDPPAPSIAKDSFQPEKEKKERRLKKKEQRLSGTKSKIIGPKGGHLHYKGYGLEVPAEALSEEREMSITIQDSDGNYYDVDFRPHVVDFGADGWFKKPVKITIHFDDADLSGIDPATITVVWYDEATGEWIDVDSDVDIKKNKVVAYVWHFTQYSLSTR